jgi:hypothetical protein
LESFFQREHSPMPFRPNRRSFLESVLPSWAAVASLFDRATAAATANKVRLGAIRWDAWYGADSAPGSSEWYATHDLDPPQYHRRAPFFAKDVGRGRLSINGTQQDINAEILYAAKAAIKYWAFGWYQSGRPMHNAWEFYQNSPNRHLVNWCVLIGINSLAENFPPKRNLVSYFEQPQYEKVGDRPILYVRHEKASLAKAAQSLSELRAECASVGLGNPYVVVQCPVPSLGALEARRIGADAISAYTSAPTISHGPVPYAALDNYVQKFWVKMGATGLQVVPNGMTGWDLRPRIESPPPFDRIVANLDAYVTPGTPAEIAAHVSALVSFVEANSRMCSAHTALIYSWDEFDEGGSALCPTWSDKGPDHSLLDAIAAVTR